METTHEQDQSPGGLIAVDGCTANSKYWIVRDWGARSMRNGSLAHPGAAVIQGRDRAFEDRR